MHATLPKLPVTDKNLKLRTLITIETLPFLYKGGQIRATALKSLFKQTSFFLI